MRCLNTPCPSCCATLLEHAQAIALTKLLGFDVASPGFHVLDQQMHHAVLRELLLVSMLMDGSWVAGSSGRSFEVRIDAMAASETSSAHSRPAAIHTARAARNLAAARSTKALTLADALRPAL